MLLSFDFILKSNTTTSQTFLYLQGNPIKQVYWLKDGVNMGHSDKVLRIDSVKKEDKGMYQVTVKYIDNSCFLLQ